VHSESRTKRLAPSILKFNDGKADGQVKMEPFILSHKDKFKSADAFAGAALWSLLYLPGHQAGRAEWNIAPPIRNAAPQRVN